VHTEVVGDLAEGEQASGAEPFVVAFDAVVAAEVEHDPVGEGLAFAGAVAGGVELRGGGLGVGVLVEQAVEQGERVGVGLAGLPGGPLRERSSAG